MPKKFINYFVINAPIPIKIGQLVKLSDKQAKRRKHVAKQLKKGGDVWECVIPFQFKAGEIFGSADPINKRLVNQMIDPEEIEPKEEPKEKVETFDPLKILKEMSKHQLQYYARVKCEGLKLPLKMDIGDMETEIREYHAENPEEVEKKTKKSTLSRIADSLNLGGDENADTV